MLQMIYSSAATQPFSSDALDTLLYKARSRNALYKVSGMLVYHNESFLQVLEGPEEGVETILASVYRDARHCKTRTLLKKTIATREFPDWSMGFRRVEAFGTRPAGHVDYVRELPAMGTAATDAKRFLRFFQEGMYRQATPLL